MKKDLQTIPGMLVELRPWQTIMEYWAFEAALRYHMRAEVHGSDEDIWVCACVDAASERYQRGYFLDQRLLLGSKNSLFGFKRASSDSKDGSSDPY
jgi:hypothetical protein